MPTSKPPALFTGWDESLFGPAPGAADDAIGAAPIGAPSLLGPPQVGLTQEDDAPLEVPAPNAPVGLDDSGPQGTYAALLGRTETAKLARDTRYVPAPLPTPAPLVASTAPPPRTVEALLQPQAAFLAALPAAWLAQQINAASVYDDRLLTAADQGAPPPARDLGPDTEAVLRWGATVVPTLVRAAATRDWATLADHAEAALRVSLAWAPAAIAWRWVVPTERAVQGVALDGGTFPMAPDVAEGSLSWSVWLARQRGRALLALAAQAYQRGDVTYAARLAAHTIGATDVIFEGDPLDLDSSAAQALLWPAAWYLLGSSPLQPDAPPPGWDVFPHAVARSLNRLWDEELRHVLPGEEVATTSLAAALLVVHTGVGLGWEFDAAQTIGRGWRHPDFDDLWRGTLDPDTARAGLHDLLQEQQRQINAGTWRLAADDPLHAMLTREAGGGAAASPASRGQTVVATVSPTAAVSLLVGIAGFVVLVVTAFVTWLLSSGG